MTLDDQCRSWEILADCCLLTASYILTWWCPSCPLQAGFFLTLLPPLVAPSLSGAQATNPRDLDSVSPLFLSPTPQNPILAANPVGATVKQIQNPTPSPQARPTTLCGPGNCCQDPSAGISSLVPASAFDPTTYWLCILRPFPEPSWAFHSTQADGWLETSLLTQRFIKGKKEEMNE